MNIARGGCVVFTLPAADSCCVAGRALEREQAGRRGEVEIQGEDRVA